MKNRIVSAALAVAAAVGGTLTLTGTASAQTVIAPPRVTASVECNSTTERGTLVVSITNRFSSRATGSLRTPFGSDTDVRIGSGSTEVLRFATRQSRVERGTVNVELRSGSTRSTISTTYQTKDCVTAPDIIATGADGGNDLLDTVTVTNRGDEAVDVTVTAGALRPSRRIAANSSFTFTLDDTARSATVRAARTVGGRTYTTTRYVFA